MQQRSFTCESQWDKIWVHLSKLLHVPYNNFLMEGFIEMNKFITSYNLQFNPIA